MKPKKQPLTAEQRANLKCEMVAEIHTIDKAVRLTPNLFAKNPNTETHIIRELIMARLNTVRSAAKTLGIGRPFEQLSDEFDIDEFKLNALDRRNEKIKELTARIYKNMEIAAAHPEYESLVFCPAAQQLQADLAEFEKLHGMEFMEYMKMHEFISQCNQKEK